MHSGGGRGQSHDSLIIDGVGKIPELIAPHGQKIDIPPATESHREKANALTRAGCMITAVFRYQPASPMADHHWR